MRFTKMHGAGNDYVFVDVFASGLEDAPAWARRLSDRRTGIGADGLILLAPSGTADVRMVMYNADGSRAQMCGNGLRCLAHFAHRCGRSDRNPLRVETDAGIKVVELAPGTARVDMGPPRFEPEALPVLLRGPRVVDYPVEIDGETFPMTCVSMGNPHAVLYVSDVGRLDVEHYGSALETHEIFPERVNVSFVQVLDRGRVRQRTWERGSGETRACGTGASAVCVAGVVSGRTDGRLRSFVPGGELLLEWDGEGSVFLTGPVAEVFAGEWTADGV